MKPAKIRSVAVVSPYSHYPGHHWIMVDRLSCELAQRGIDVDVFVSGTPILPQTELRHRTVNICAPFGTRIAHRLYRTLLARPRLLSMFHNWDTFWCLLRLSLSGKRYDAIHCTDGTFLLVFLCVLCSSKPVVYNVWGGFNVAQPESGKTSKGFRASLRHRVFQRALDSGRFWLVCETQSMKARINPALRDHVHVIPFLHFSSTELVASGPVTKEEARIKFNLPPDAPVLLIFGTHRLQKNYQPLFEALQSIQQPIWLLFAGSVISEYSPSNLAAACHFSRFISIERFITEEEVPLIFTAADAVVLPYEKGFDRGSGILLMACQFKKPVIASRSGMMEDFVTEFGTGFLFDSENAVALRAAILDFLQASSDEKSRLNTRIDYASSIHTWAVIGEKYVRIYESRAAPAH